MAEFDVHSFVKQANDSFDFNCCCGDSEEIKWFFRISDAKAAMAHRLADEIHRRNAEHLGAANRDGVLSRK
jgi:hypothetical protein